MSDDRSSLPFSWLAQMATRALGRPAPNSVAALTAGADRLLGLALIASAGLLALGWLAPMMTVKRLFLFEERISIIDGLITLVEHGEWALFLIVVVFSVLFPAAKLALSYRLWLSGDVRDPRFEARLKRIEGLGKWSMLDVFLVALAVAAIKISVIADVHLHWGLYAFAAGILLSMTAFARLTTIASRLRLGRHGGGRKTRPDA